MTDVATKTIYRIVQAMEERRDVLASGERPVARGRPQKVYAWAVGRREKIRQQVRDNSPRFQESDRRAFDRSRFEFDGTDRAATSFSERIERVRQLIGRSQSSTDPLTRERVIVQARAEIEALRSTSRSQEEFIDIEAAAANVRRTAADGPALAMLQAVRNEIVDALADDIPDVVIGVKDDPAPHAFVFDTIGSAPVSNVNVSDLARTYGMAGQVVELAAMTHEARRNRLLTLCTFFGSLAGAASHATILLDATAKSRMLFEEILNVIGEPGNIVRAFDTARTRVGHIEPSALLTVGAHSTGDTGAWLKKAQVGSLSVNVKSEPDAKLLDFMLNSPWILFADGGGVTPPCTLDEFMGRRAGAVSFARSMEPLAAVGTAFSSWRDTRH